MALAANDAFDHIPQAPNLQGQITIRSYKPVYSGPYSFVYRGELKGQQRSKPVAIKVLHVIKGANDTTMLRKLERERRAWAACRHPNILPLYGFVEDDDIYKPFGGLWHEQGDAADFLQAHGRSLSVEKRANLWKGVVAGVHYLHSYRPVLVHGDLKPRNILIDDTGNAQICDFGLVRVCVEDGKSGTTTTTAHTGTERYLARELLVEGDEARPTRASDIYALGCIGLEFLFLKMPYSHRKNNFRGSIFADIKNGVPPAHRPPDIALTLQEAWTHLAECWDVTPLKRPSALLLFTWLETWISDTMPLGQLSLEPRSADQSQKEQIGVPSDPPSPVSSTGATVEASLLGQRRSPLGPRSFKGLIPHVGDGRSHPPNPPAHSSDLGISIGPVTTLTTPASMSRETVPSLPRRPIIHPVESFQLRRTLAVSVVPNSMDGVETSSGGGLESFDLSTFDVTSYVHWLNLGAAFRITHGKYASQEELASTFNAMKNGSPLPSFGGLAANVNNIPPALFDNKATNNTVMRNISQQPYASSQLNYPTVPAHLSSAWETREAAGNSVNNLHHSENLQVPEYIPETQSLQWFIQFQKELDQLVLPAGISVILFYVQALFDYAATTGVEFDFWTGDIIAVVQTREDGWWEGILLNSNLLANGHCLMWSIIPHMYRTLFPIYLDIRASSYQ